MFKIVKKQCLILGMYKEHCSSTLILGGARGVVRNTDVEKILRFFCIAVVLRSKTGSSIHL